MRIVLISTPTRLFAPNLIPPLGIMALAAYLEPLGHEVKILDAAHRRPHHHDIAQEVADFAPDIIGVSGIATVYAYMIGLTYVLKQRFPTIPIVIGGTITINTTRLCFEHMSIDYMVHGYGEIPTAKLLEHLEGRRDIKTIPGLSYIENGRIATNPGREFVKSVDELPLPAYDKVDMEHYCTSGSAHAIGLLEKHLKMTGKTANNNRWFCVMGAMGCVAKCTFCIHEQEQVGVRFFSPEYIVNHMRFLREKYNINIFSIGEDMFLSKVDIVRQINKLLAEQLPDVYWETCGRVEAFTQEMVDELQKGKVYSTGFGTESLCNRILDTMNKCSTREANIESAKRIVRAKMVFASGFMVGNVGENQESIKETLQGISQLEPPFDGWAFFATAYPGGRIWDWAVEQGIIPDPHAYLLRLFNQDAASYNINLTPFPNWIVRYWGHRMNMALRLVNQKRKIWSSKRINLSLFTGAAVSIYFLARKVGKALGLWRDDPRYDYVVDADGVLLPKQLRKGNVPLGPSSKRLSVMLDRGPTYEPFVDRREQYRPPSWWRGSFVPLYPVQE